MNTMWKTTVNQLIIAIIACTIMTIVWSFRAPELVFGSAMGTIIFIFTLALELYLSGSRLADKISNWVFFGVNIVLISIICLNHETYIRGHFPFEPFIGMKTIAVFLPILCPPKRWVGWSTLVLLAIVPLQRYYSWDSPVQARLGIQEPWMTFIFAVGSGITYHFRLRLEELKDFEIEMTAKAKALQRFAHLLLGTQHLINTPLQTIEIGFYFIRARFPDTADIVAIMARCFAAIRRVSRTLAFSDANIRWDNVDLPSTTDQLENEMKKILVDYSPPAPAK